MSSRESSRDLNGDMNSELLVKRKREEMEDSTLLHGNGAPSGIQRSDLWFDDGNVILEAEKTQFRVHRGVLSKHSIAFRELRYPDHECPIIELSDSAQDLRYLLDALYEWSFRFCSCLPLPMVLALIRLSHKYQISKIRKDILVRLHEEWPTEYDEWISRSRPAYKIIGGESERVITLRMLLAAREFDLKSLLPALYLNTFSLFSLDEIEDGFTAANEVQIKLPMEERLRLAMGLIRLRYILTTKGWSALNEVPVSGCVTLLSVKEADHLCYKAKVAVYSQKFKDGDDSLQGVRPRLLPLNAQLSGNFCAVCYEAVLRFNQSRRDVWDLLPSFFKLPEWTVLKGE